MAPPPLDEFITLLQILLDFTFVGTWMEGRHLRNDIFPDTNLNAERLKNLLQSYRKFIKGTGTPFPYLTVSPFAEFLQAFTYRASEEMGMTDPYPGDVAIVNKAIREDLCWDDQTDFDWNEIITKGVYGHLIHIDWDIFQWMTSSQMNNEWNTTWMDYDFGDNDEAKMEKNE